jgi:hypothetical protein
MSHGFIRAHKLFQLYTRYLCCPYGHRKPSTDVLVTLLQTQAEVALAAADGDPNVAIEILMSQQG